MAMNPEVLRAMKDLLARIEAAVDSCTDLTRKSASGFMYEAELVFSRWGWTACCKVRGVHAKGRGAKSMFACKGEGTTPETAVEDFIRGLVGASFVLNK